MRRLSLKSWGLMSLGCLGVIGIGINYRYQTVKNFEGKEPFRLAVVETGETPGRVALVSYYPQEKQVEILDVGGERWVETAKDYGRYRWGVLDQLDASEKLDGGLVTATLMKNYGLLVRDRVRLTGKVQTRSSAWVRRVFWQYSWQGKGWIAKLDAWRILLKVLDLREPEVMTVDLDKLPVWQTADALEPIWVFDPSKFDREVSLRRFRLPQEVTVMVENGSGRDGLGEAVTRILDREGFLVIRTGTLMETEVVAVNTQVRLVKDQETDLSQKLLAQIVGGEMIQLTEEGSLAQVEIRLGPDFTQF
ncbi:hypothetical protein A2W24_04545 [Microgenomates group bacterium RBG_16_45_19]|nr:MAG: hypothetical protein A2W24_04545 [Microgenomates group bacterium RBG_16_45_19]